ncbi:MAG: DNA cytosine methyltransferase, partial [Polaromonas sp.]
SVAGLRKSLDDARGNLSLTFCEIANAIDTVRTGAGQQPAIIFWENVLGVLSTKDNAFGCFLAGLAGEDGELEPAGGKWTNAGVVYGPTRTVAWRVLDAQYFGVAQRRRRVFVVASARDDFDPAEVLFEFDGVRRDTAPSRETREGIAGGIEIGPSGGRLTDLNPTLDTRAKDGPIRNQLAGAVMQPTAYSTKMHNTTSNQTGKFYEEYSTSLDANSPPPAVFHPIAIQDVRPIEKAQNGRGWNDDGAAYTVDTHATQGVAQPIAFSSKDHGADATADLSPTLRAMNHADSHANGGGQMAVMQPIGCFKGGQGSAAGGIGYDEHIAPTLSASDSGSNRTPALMHGMVVRRLTPVECERLQGFPDGYTAIPWRKKPADQCPDGPRYKALGNSWAVPNVRWIGERIQVVERVSNPPPTQWIPAQVAPETVAGEV